MGPAALPLGLWPSAALAAVPVVLVFVLLGPLRVPGYRAALAGAAAAAALALTVWQMPPVSALAAAAYGMAFAAFPVIYLIAGSLLLYNLTVASGWSSRLRQVLARALPDRQLLLLLIGFGFAAFLDSTAGFLTPVAVGTALLVGLGVPALEAAGYALVASSLPPVFGAMGIPVVVLAGVTGLPMTPLVERQAALAAALFVGFPAWLTLTFGGWQALRRLWLPALATGAAYAAVLWWVATRISPYPAALAASVAAMLATVAAARRTPVGAVLLPWWPYLLLMVMVTAWSLPGVSGPLGRFSLAVPLPSLPGPVLWKLDLLASPGTAILLSAVAFGVMARLTASQWREAALATYRQLKYPVINMLAMFTLAQVMGFSGMTSALGRAAAAAGHLFLVLSPFVSWLGAGIAGSNTAAHAMLGQLQATTAAHLGLDALTLVALAGAAAPLGKMVAPQVLSAAAGAGNLVGMEGRLLRIGLFHSLTWTAIIAAAGWFLAGRP